ncbi:LysE family translocator [Kalamiella sp. sgz302252]|uniref:LysE family translocator n=1 Tax=Pantoea sp. sgz302252 TaxID=3341827 RepID=UPI0036D2853D
MMPLLLTLWPVYLAYLLGTASPGPSNLAIMGVAMRHGRRSALALAAGVITGSMFWATLVACGLSTLLLAWSEALIVIKLVGGCYLLWLAFKAARSAARKGEGSLAEKTVAEATMGAFWRRGVLLHLANPKAIMVWLAIISLGMHPGAPAATLPLIVGGCALLGMLVFGSYALLFSTATAGRVYFKARRLVEGTFALFFGAAGIKMLTGK